MKTGSIVLRVFGVLLLVALLAGGAFAAYRFGYAQGVAQSPAIAEAFSQGMKEGSVIPAFGGPMLYGHGYPIRSWGHSHFGFFPFLGCLGPLFFMFLFFGLLRLVFFRRHWGWHGHWHGHPSEWGAPPWARGGPEQPAAEKPAGQPEKPQDETK